MLAGKPRRKISVIVTCFNFQDYIGECLDSLLNQTLKPFEIFIFDDCSTDNSWRIISHFARLHPDLIRTCRFKKNRGAGGFGLNSGLKKISGDYCCWLDGDDRWHEEKLETEWLALHMHPQALAAYSDVNLIDSSGAKFAEWCAEQETGKPQDLFCEVFSRRFFKNSRSVFRNELRHTDTIERKGHLDMHLQGYRDWDQKIRLAARCLLVGTGRKLVDYRQHSQGMSKRQQQQWGGLIQVYEKHLPLLRTRPLAQELRLRANMEALIAIEQKKWLPLVLNSTYTADRVSQRIRGWLKELASTGYRGMATTELEKELDLLAGDAGVLAGIINR